MAAFLSTVCLAAVTVAAAGGSDSTASASEADAIAWQACLLQSSSSVEAAALPAPTLVPARSAEAKRRPKGGAAARRAAAAGAGAAASLAQAGRRAGARAAAAVAGAAARAVRHAAAPLEELALRAGLVASLWLAVTLTICWMLWNVRSDATTLQGSPCQTIGVISYVIAAVVVVPAIVASSLSPVALVRIQIAGLLALLLTEATPHLLGLGAIAWGRSRLLSPSATLSTQASTPTFPGPPLCICIAARISNETDTLPATLSQFLPTEDGGQGVRIPKGSLILLAYNPRPNQAEQACLKECARIAAMIPGTSFQALNVPDGKCKADVVNAALAFLAAKPTSSQPGMICFMDADIILKHKDGLISGIRQLQVGHPKVSALSATRINIHTGSFLVAAEFQLKQFLNTGYGCLLGTGWMTGALLIMRTELALKYGFDSHCLVEDNDMLVRMAADGHFCSNPADIEVMTEAPPGLKSFLTQRTRWAQGATWVAMFSLPLALAAGSLGGACLAHRAQAKTRWIIFWIFLRAILKYLVPLLIPAFVAVTWHCGSSCAVPDGLFELRGALYWAYICQMVSIIAAAAALDHPWLKW
ncbi:unnamed protein product [Prorocentrum cordatum]|uniref:Glycosyltransferase 2-like domain-containing protein n=1 Tax=Prorocentrum cordatum TaxID=2364126 RepID=A0ABN9SAG8_9DINO|nr:unnamed protein product [Polarella glacialis]